MRVQLSPSPPFNIKSKKINRPFYKPFRKFDPSRPKANEQIRVPEVRVINENGENIGVISTQEALGMAKQAGLDLVEISKDAIPPVVKIIDIGKYIYQKDKSEREKKSKQKASELKIIKIGLATSEHDSLTKIKKLEEFLADGDKVKIEMFLKGRQRANKVFAREKFEKFLSLVPKEGYKIDQPLKGLPTGFTITISK